MTTSAEYAEYARLAYFNPEDGEADFTKNKVSLDSDNAEGWIFKFPDKDVISLRDDEAEECRGRLTGDIGRLKVGLQVGRLFGVKSGKQAGDWLPIEAFFRDESIVDSD